MYAYIKHIEFSWAIKRISKTEGFLQLRCYGWVSNFRKGIGKPKAKERIATFAEETQLRAYTVLGWLIAQRLSLALNA